MIVEDQNEVIDRLSEPGVLGPPDTPVERIDTHASVVFLTDRRAYKLKRAVRFPYLDYSGAERRRRFCEAEVRINRRTAPDLYLGVVPVGRAADGRLAPGAADEPVDWLVEMARFDQETLYDRLAERGALDRFAMEDLADAIARFHAAAERRDDFGGADAIERVIESNARSFAECPPHVLDAEAAARLTAASREALARCRDRLDRRRRDGLVRHCHGDLHLRNIFVHAGRATLFDAIEFDDDLAMVDVLYDLAFLLMDLDHRGLRSLASIVLNRYLDITADADGLAALPLFLSVRAAIRAHVEAVAAASQTEPGEAGVRIGEARRYLDSAGTYLAPPSPRLAAFGGLSGSGKSRAAREVAPLLGAAPGARIVRTDSTRKRLAGVPLGSRLGPEGYTPEMTARTYAAVFDEVRTVLAAGHSAIADAVFADAGERRAVAEVAEAAGVPFTGVWLEAPPEVMQDRVRFRRRNVSDATAAVVRMQLAFDLGDVDWTRVDTGGSREDSTRHARRALGLEH